jgi:hypothetical protein
VRRIEWRPYSRAVAIVAISAERLRLAAAAIGASNGWR